MEQRSQELQPGRHAVAVEHVGSTAVPGLDAKPILDIAVGLRPDVASASVVRRLRAEGFIHRGDQHRGGTLFVAEDEPPLRTAHIHVVALADETWRRYIAFRNRLRSDATARARYAVEKQRLAEQFPHDRVSYTAGKEAVITSLL